MPSSAELALIVLSSLSTAGLVELESVTSVGVAVVPLVLVSAASLVEFYGFD